MTIKILGKYSKQDVNRAGDILRNETDDQDALEWAEEVLENWRGRHAYPINTFQSTLREKLNAIDKNSIVAQRLKRSPSIVNKLQRFKKMELSRMQDIGGLRAVVSTIEKAFKLKDNYKKTIFQHKLVGEKDYIQDPKTSGYRGIHLIYRYKNIKVPEFDDLLLELQIRTKLQHIWATSVETVGTFLEHSLKTNEGPNEWLNFFALVSSAFAIIENRPKVPTFETLSTHEIYKRVASETIRLGVIDKLKAFNVAANHISKDKKGGTYHLLLLNLEDSTISIKSYSRKRFEEASKEYTKFERLDNKKFQVVLVSTTSIETLRKAYPNYFLDTHEFIIKLNEVIKDYNL